MDLKQPSREVTSPERRHLQMDLLNTNDRSMIDRLATCITEAKKDVQEVGAEGKLSGQVALTVLTEDIWQEITYVCPESGSGWMHMHMTAC